MTADVWRAVPGTTWQDRASQMLRDTLTGPRGEPCFVTTDRRWLWRLENALGVSAPVGNRLCDLQRDLLEYLRETCEHHMQTYAASGDIAAHQQCTFCHHVVWAGEETS